MARDYVYLYKGRCETEDMGMNNKIKNQGSKIKNQDSRFKVKSKTKADSAFKRSLVYEVLSYAFIEPSTEFFEFVKSGELFAIIRDALISHPEVREVDMSPIIDAVVEARNIDMERVGNLYQGLISPRHSFLHECRYHNPFSAYNEMADIAGFYTAFGLGFDKERSDHISMELEFMRLLTLKEAKALMDNEPENLNICISAQKRFLESHPGRWVHLLSEAVEGITFYGHVCKFLNTYMEAECRLLSIKPEKLKGAFLNDLSEGVCSVACMKEE